jgi:hypothetical protein
MFLGLKGFSEAPYIWAGIIIILASLFLGLPIFAVALIVGGTVVWIYGDKIHGCL